MNLKLKQGENLKGKYRGELHALHTSKSYLLQNAILIGMAIALIVCVWVFSLHPSLLLFLLFPFILLRASRTEMKSVDCNLFVSNIRVVRLTRNKNDQYGFSYNRLQSIERHSDGIWNRSIVFTLINNKKHTFKFQYGWYQDQAFTKIRTEWIEYFEENKVARWLHDLTKGQSSSYKPYHPVLNPKYTGSFSDNDVDAKFEFLDFFTDQPQIRFDLTLPFKTTDTFHIRKEPSSLSESITSKLHDIKLDSPSFDEMYFIKGNNPSAVKAIFKSDIQRAALDLVTSEFIEIKLGDNKRQSNLFKKKESTELIDDVFLEEQSKLNELPLSNKLQVRVKYKVEESMLVSERLEMAKELHAFTVLLCQSLMNHYAGKHI